MEERTRKGLTDSESSLARSASAWSIACTSAASPASLTMKYGLMSARSVFKTDVSYTEMVR